MKKLRKTLQCLTELAILPELYRDALKASLNCSEDILRECGQFYACLLLSELEARGLNLIYVCCYYNELRKVSDELCRKHGLSVIRSGTNVPDHSRHYAEWKAENEGRPTWCSAIKEDVDAAIASSATFEQFIRQLKAMGYEVKTNVKHMAVRPPGKERFTRLRRLGDNYTEEAMLPDQQGGS